MLRKKLRYASLQKFQTKLQLPGYPPAASVLPAAPAREESDTIQQCGASLQLTTYNFNLSCIMA